MTNDVFAIFLHFFDELLERIKIFLRRNFQSKSLDDCSFFKSHVDFGDNLFFIIFDIQNFVVAFVENFDFDGRSVQFEADDDIIQLLLGFLHNFMDFLIRILGRFLLAFGLLFFLHFFVHRVNFSLLVDFGTVPVEHDVASNLLVVQVNRSLLDLGLPLQLLGLLLLDFHFLVDEPPLHGVQHRLLPLLLLRPLAPLNHLPGLRVGERIPQFDEVNEELLEHLGVVVQQEASDQDIDVHHFDLFILVGFVHLHPRADLGVLKSQQMLVVVLHRAPRRILHFVFFSEIVENHVFGGLDLLELAGVVVDDETVERELDLSAQLSHGVQNVDEQPL